MLPLSLIMELISSVIPQYHRLRRYWRAIASLAFYALLLTAVFELPSKYLYTTTLKYRLETAAQLNALLKDSVSMSTYETRTLKSYRTDLLTPHVSLASQLSKAIASSSISQNIANTNTNGNENKMTGLFISLSTMRIISVSWLSCALLLVVALSLAMDIKREKERDKIMFSFRIVVFISGVLALCVLTGALYVVMLLLPAHSFGLMLLEGSLLQICTGLFALLPALLAPNKAPKTTATEPQEPV